ncbi:hypothetical protein Droror1_Dr00010423 [Drosera rotundifolia]
MNSLSNPLHPQLQLLPLTPPMANLSISRSHSLSIPSHFLSQIPASHKTLTQNLVIIPSKPSRTCTITSRSTTPTSNPTTYSGWDDPIPQFDPKKELGNSNHVIRLLISMGFDDVKYLYVYAFGFLCAVAVSRIRVSSIVVFPACVVVFGIGFSFGYLNGGPVKGMGVFGGKRKGKEGSSRVLDRVLEGLEERVGELRNDIKRVIESGSVGVDELVGFVSAVEAIEACSSSARNVVEDCVPGLGAEDGESHRGLDQKSNRRKKENAQNGFDLFQFVSGFMGKDANGSKSSKKNGSVSSEGKDAIRRSQKNLLASIVEEGRSNLKTTSNAGTMNIEEPCGSASYRFLNQDARSRSVDRGEEIRRLLDYAKTNAFEQSVRRRRIIDDEEFENQVSNRFRFVEKRQSTFKTTEYNEMVGRSSRLDSLDSNSSLQRLEMETSFTCEQIKRNSDEAYKFFQDTKMTGSTSDEAGCRGDEMVNDLHPSHYRYGAGSGSSSTFSDDLMFDRYLTEANSLLKGAKECLKVREDEFQAEKMLLDCAELLSKAIAMKPMSLLAVGLLGNTYLLHGELKLRISLELRSLLIRRENFSLGRQSVILDELECPLPSRDRVTTLLVDVCQECEDFLIEAGRRYRTALSIDGNDMRALYNWGLALSFRAQLIADIGPEAAVDADKLFLAAIDKFDAMMARSNVYAPDALFRWGMALQQRSRLRPHSSTSKMKLLQQAKRLYEDAIDMGSDNLLVKEALSSCVYELDSRRN